MIYTYLPCITLPPCTACLYVICPVPFPGGRSFSAVYICGDAHFAYAEEVRNLIRENQLTNVFLTDFISQSEKIWLYRNCEAFLLPSEGEGFGLPVVEAMQFGKAVFAANSLGSFLFFFLLHFRDFNGQDPVFDFCGNLIPVSYTHLDVYKRQVYNWYSLDESVCRSGQETKDWK